MERKKANLHSSRLIFFYLAIGFFLGLGAPAGSILLRSFGNHQQELLGWIRDEFSRNAWFYGYMTVGTVTAFMAAGFAAVYVDLRLRERARVLTEKARELEEKSVKDPMTGLYNFGFIRPRLAVELERAKRFQTPLSCLMIDVDHLKQINDQWGHPAGDELLKRIAQVLQSEIRVIDTATRYGGDEFFLILPVTNLQGALIVAERIRAKAHELNIPFKDTFLQTSLSIGAASYP